VKEKAKFLFFCTIFVGSAVFCQNPLQKTGKLLFKGATKIRTKNLFSLDNQPASYAVTAPVLSSGFYVSQLGFFCKQEIKFEQSTKIPFRFRLGSVSECDWLEGKMNR
jgi:hypothetical protein